MRKLLLTIALVTSFVIGASAQYYEFTVKTEEYVAFEGSIISPPDWDTESGTLPLPFPVDIFAEEVDAITISDILFTFSYNSMDIANFAAFGADLKSRNSFESPITIDVIGTSPNSILKAQVKNAGFKGDNTDNDYINYQVWIYETTNVIEIHYGDGSVTNTSGSFFGQTGPLVGLLKANNGGGIMLSGNPVNPDVIYNPVAEYFLNGTPDSGTVYTFTPRKNPVGVNQVLSSGIEVLIYPNPFTDILTVNIGDATPADVKVTDATGKLVYTGSINGSEIKLNTADYKQGVYFVRVSTSEGIITRKIVKN